MEALKRYCDAVCRRVRYPFVRKQIRAELTAHWEDRTEALCQRGHPQEEAERLAVEAMGDPVETGTALNKLYPPFWHWLTRGLCTLALLLVLVVGWTALGYTLEDDWTYYGILAEDARTAQEQLEDQLLTTHGWQQRVVARGRVTGGGRLGDYTFSVGSTAQLIDSPAFVQNGNPRKAFQELQFILVATHHQPWLPSLTLNWANPTITDGAGNAVSAFDPNSSLYAGAYRQSLLTDYISCSLKDPQPGQTDFTFSLAGPDGRVITFSITLDQWEDMP